MSHNLFGERLRALRKQAGLTQQAVAGRLSIHRTAYTKYETSGVMPDPMGLLVLAGKPLGLWRMRNRLIKSAADIQTSFDYRFGENAFEVSFPGESMSFAYGAVSRIVETEAYYFVYTDERMAHILPKKDFSQGDANTFGKFIAEKTGLKLEWNKAK